MKKGKLIVLLVFLTVFCFSLPSCATYRTSIDMTADAPQSYVIKDVPFVKQKPYYCGPASAEMVLRYHGIDKYDQDIIARCDSSNPKGSHWEKLTAFLNWKGRKDGFVANKKYGNIDLLKKYISSDYPVIVRQWENQQKKAKHYRVVTGYDDIQQEILLHDPNTGPDIKMKYNRFNELWNVQTANPHWNSKNLMIIIGKIPKNK